MKILMFIGIAMSLVAAYVAYKEYDRKLVSDRSSCSLAEFQLSTIRIADPFGQTQEYANREARVNRVCERFR